MSILNTTQEHRRLFMVRYGQLLNVSQPLRLMSYRHCVFGNHLYLRSFDRFTVRSEVMLRDRSKFDVGPVHVMPFFSESDAGHVSSHGTPFFFPPLSVFACCSNHCANTDVAYPRLLVQASTSHYSNIHLSMTLGIRFRVVTT